MRGIGWFLLCLTLIGINAASSGEARLTRLFGDGYDFWDCDWSPGGFYLALAGKEHQQPGEKSRIWLYVSGAEKPVLWTNTDAYCDDWPRWSPDGKYLALARRELATRQTCIWWKDVATGAGQRLTEGPDDRQPSWSPDGQSIVFRRGLGPQQSVLAIFSAITGKTSVLPIKPGLVGEPCWGPDGAIYYTRYQALWQEIKSEGQTYLAQVISGGRLWRYHLTTSEDKPLLNDTPERRMPAPSPDGKWLAFFGQRGNPGPVHSIPNPASWALFLRNQATGKITEVVTDVALTGGPPAWSRNSMTVTFYSLRQTRPALWSCALADYSLVDAAPYEPDEF